MQAVILPAVYAGNITYFRHLASGRPVIIDVHEHFVKRSYRNRTRILGPNGPQDLIIPVHWDSRTPMIEVAIDRSKKWQANHWKSINAAYAASPFFIHYAPLIQPLYRQSFTSLVEFNLQLQEVILKAFSITVDVTLSKQYMELDNALDLRGPFKPSREKPVDHPEYIQVFGDRYDFITNLSALDVLFNLGPEARNIITL